MSSRAYKFSSFRKAEPEGPVDRTRVAMICLQIGAASFVLLGLLLIVISLALDPSANADHGYQVGIIWLLAALSIACTALLLIVARAFRRRKRWAWRTARALFIILYLPTIVLLPIGIIGLYGLMSEGTRAKFSGARGYIRKRRR